LITVLRLAYFILTWLVPWLQWWKKIYGIIKASKRNEINKDLSARQSEHATTVTLCLGIFTAVFEDFVTLLAIFAPSGRSPLQLAGDYILRGSRVFTICSRIGSSTLSIFVANLIPSLTYLLSTKARCARYLACLLVLRCVDVLLPVTIFKSLFGMVHLTFKHLPLQCAFHYALCLWERSSIIDTI